MTITEIGILAEAVKEVNIDKLAMVFTIIGGLGIFLLGMKNMSEGIQAVAGDRLRKMINAVTNNRLMACGVGTGVTMLVQSSSITTVMVVGMVNAGVMTLVQAIGVILGANIGTTITGWILVLKVGKYGLPLIGAAAIVYLFSKKDRIKFTASFLVGLGMVFYGLMLMKNGFKPIRGLESFNNLFSRFEIDVTANYFITYISVLKCAFIGAILTMIVQSSSATLGITISLAAVGAIDFYQAAALVLGENIGTTITAMLASIGTNVFAKRAAYAHIMINIIGVFWITLIFPFYVTGVKYVTTEYWPDGGDPDQVVNILDENGNQKFDENGLAEIDYPYIDEAIALTHTGFNVVNSLAFMPFLGVLAAFLTRMIPERGVKVKKQLVHLDVRMLETPAIGIQQSYSELIRMGESNKQMLALVNDVVSTIDVDKDKVDRIFSLEIKIDVYQKEVVEYLSHILTGTVSLEVSDRARAQVRIADELESISDYITNLLKLNLKMRNTDLTFSDQGRVELAALHNIVETYLQMIFDAMAVEDGSVLNKAQEQGNAITYAIKESRGKHLHRVADGSTKPLASLIFTDTLNAYRRIKDHALNIGEVLSGEK